MWLSFLFFLYLVSFAFVHVFFCFFLIVYMSSLSLPGDDVLLQAIFVSVSTSLLSLFYFFLRPCSLPVWFGLVWFGSVYLAAGFVAESVNNNVR